MALQPKAQKQQNPHIFLASQIPHIFLAVFFRWADGKDRDQEPVGKVLLDFHHLANKWSLQKGIVLHLFVALSWSAVKTFMVSCHVGKFLRILWHLLAEVAKKLRGHQFQIQAKLAKNLPKNSEGGVKHGNQCGTIRIYFGKIHRFRITQKI